MDARDGAYRPEPIETSVVVLSDDVLALGEALARHAHEHWARQRLNEGWRYGPARDDARKEHPGLVPYEALSAGEKAYDRIVSLETLKAIVALGYRLERQDTADSNLPASRDAEGEQP